MSYRRLTCYFLSGTGNSFRAACWPAEALYYLFWGMQRLRPLHAFWSHATWTRYFRRRYHEPETQQKHLQQGERLPPALCP